MCSGVAVERKTSVLRRPESSLTGCMVSTCVSGSCFLGRKLSTHPPLDLFHFAEHTERLDDGLGHLQVLWRVLLEHAQQDGQRALANVLRLRR